MVKRIARRIGYLVVALPGLAAFFILVAFAFALLPARGRGQSAEGEPPLYLCASLAHADIVMPGSDPLVDWGRLFPEVVTPSLPPQAYLAFGWGDLTFFRETPSWGDLKVSTAISALAGQHETALRIVAVNPPKDRPDCLTLRVDRAGRRALIAHIEATLRLDAADRPQWRPGGAGLEAYYLAKGRYSPLRTCNQWAAEGLAAAGLPHALFAPFSFSVTWPLSALEIP
ncbi:hypothetical protein LMIY3S_04152 [Labrys miyagiensis]